MSGVPQSNASSQASRGTKRKWVPEEDATLVSCMVDLHNVGTFNADIGFKAGYLNELEKKLEKALPNAMLKAKPNIESRIRLLKREDRATGKDAQTVADVLEEINADDVPTTNMNKERNSFYDCEVDVSLDDMDVSTTEPRGDKDQGGSSSSNKKKKKSDARDNMSSSFNEAATLLAENMQAIGDQISRSIASDVVVQQKSEEFQIIQEKATNLYSTLWEIEGLTVDERYRALSKIPDHPTQMLVFFSLPYAARLEWVRRFLSDH
ncbi:hypothetical protein Gotur_024723 [Gossypium turneri]